jgi:methylated-DNA-[protein]-cysteine S-methyltransferase
MKPTQPWETRLFDTPVGRCAIAWGAHGVLAVQLPDADDAATLRRLVRGLPGRVGLPEPPDPAAAHSAAAHPAEAPPAAAHLAAVDAAIAAITDLLHGEPRDLLEIVLDLRRIPPFHQRVYEIARTIAPGTTLTYGAIAQRLGMPGAARAVGQALGSNPFVIVVPCHRVLAADGRAGGFSAPGGTLTKLRLLTIEGAFAQPAQPGDTMTLF